MHAVDQDERAFLQQLAARELLIGVAGRLNDACIPVMVLKGSWLQLVVLPEHRLRPVTDLDLLVDTRDFPRAVHVLQSAGFEARTPDPRQVVLQRPGDPMPVDLHRSLFDPQSFRLRGRAMLARSVGELDVDGVRVLLPHPMDAFAHLVGHAAHCRLRPRDPVRMRDFEDVGTRCALQPTRLALHLESLGMGRAARYVLGIAVAQSDAAFCLDVLRALASDPLGDSVARFCTWAIPRTAAANPAGGALSYLLEDSLLRSVVMIGQRTGIILARRARHATGRGSA